MLPSHFDFINGVLADRDLVVTSSAEHVCRLEPRESDLGWFCDLDDGTPTGDDVPAAHVRWVCPALKSGTPSDRAIPPLDVRRRGPESDLGKLFKGLGRLAGRTRPSTTGAEGRFVYTDPAGILDAALRQRIENWPSARHGDGVVRPVELSSIKLTREGLIVESVSWWGSAAALDHHIGLAIDLAHRLT